jgi:histone H3/H4
VALVLSTEYKKVKAKLLEHLCKALFGLDILLCKKSNDKIEEDEYVYYIKQGVVNSRNRDPTKCHRLGRLEDLRKVCQKYAVPTSSGTLNQSLPVSGSIGRLLKGNEHKVLFEEDTTTVQFQRKSSPQLPPKFGTAPTTILRHAIQDYARKQNMSVGSDVYGVLNMRILQLLIDADSRCASNHRRTLKAYDLESYSYKVERGRQCPSFVMKKAVQDFAKRKGKQVGRDFYNALNCAVTEILLEAKVRTFENKRKTLKAYDL